MIEGLREKVVAILHTKDGSRVALHCIWHGTAKVCTCRFGGVVDGYGQDH